MLKCVLMYAFVACALAATIEPEMTTRHPHHTQNPDHTHEPAVHETISFFYDFHTHQMTLSKGTDCYIFALSLAERQDVHTDAGMTVLEVKLVNLLTTAKMTLLSKDTLGHSLLNACGRKATTYYSVTQ
ncbi:uncharacterized protein LOC128212940 [Mya arenaria]|uniref:uncharacterized protein LOC128212940 n=1 Tax=Mya arenaria TaxID=6604 RepID=UPI0022E4C257|nr:uncharacterized protein LOC128212940 [Mya arenaria]